MDRPIPAFYACYLLRSTLRHQSLYVGSTPHPVRRLKQHNGESKGGAAKTARNSLRPWEMTCLVTGFPSKVAALQFEWAWQNTHLTRHIPSSSRLAQAESTVRFSPKTGRMRKRAGRPRLSLTDRLANLHQLLQSRSFGRWPLKLTFYSEDVFRVWQKWTLYDTTKLQPHVRVDLDQPSRPPTGDDTRGLVDGTGIYALDVGYKPMKPSLLKSHLLSNRLQSCTLCHRSLATHGATTLVCPRDGCTAAGHLTCFASSFLGSNSDHLVPIEGGCPGCGSTLQWVSLVKELSLRMRSPTYVAKVLKTKDEPGTKKQPIPTGTTELDADDESLHEAVEDEDWNYLSSSSEDAPAAISLQSGPAPHPKFQRPKSYPHVTMLDSVIEDSDWDDAEVIS